MFDYAFAGIKQIIYGVITLFLIIVAVSISCWIYQSGRVSQLQQQVLDLQESQKRANLAMARRETGRAAVEKTHRSAQGKLAEAAASQPAWADTPVPQEIRDAIR
jgi:hypothetical protein